MSHYSITGKYILKEDFSNLLNENISKIFSESKKEIEKELKDHQDDLLNNISSKEGNIGIGTSDPKHKLTIKSNDLNSNLNIIGTGDKGAGISLTNDLNNGGYIYYAGSKSDIGEGSIGIATNKDDTKLIIKNNGNIGLGIDPIYKLHVSGGENVKTEIGLAKSSEWGDPMIKYEPTNTNYISLGFNKGINQNSKYNIENGITINRFGSVGIKTNDPKSNLHVKNQDKLNTWIGVSSNNRETGLAIDNSGTHDFKGDDYATISIKNKDLVIENKSRNNNLVLMTGGQDRFTINKLGQITINKKLTLNKKIFRLDSGAWKYGHVYTWNHNLGYIPSFVKVYLEFIKDIDYKENVFRNGRYYEITNANDTTDSNIQRGTFITFDKNSVYLRITKYGPMILNIPSQPSGFYDVKPTDANIIVKVFDLE